MGKCPCTVLHTYGETQTHYQPHAQTPISVPPYASCTFKSSPPLTSQALIREQWTPQPPSHLNVCQLAHIPLHFSSHEVGACGNAKSENKIS